MKRLLAVAVMVSGLASGQMFRWRSVNVQGMGYVTGIVAGPERPWDIYVRTDVGGAYRLDRATRRWIPVLERFGLNQSGAHGVEAMAVTRNAVYAVTASHRIYTPTGGGYYDSADYCEVLVSTNRGRTWNALGLGPKKVACGPNSDARGTTGERAYADAQGRVWFGSRKDGLWLWDPERSEWRTVDAVGKGTTLGITFVTGAGSDVYAGVTGSGVWRSTDGGATWTNLQGGLNPARAALGPGGVLYVTFGAGESGRIGAVRRWRNEAWAEITPVPEAYAGVSTHPTDPQILVVAAVRDFKVYLSADQGATWTAIGSNTVPRNEPGYYPKPYSANFNTRAGAWGNAGLLIDPAVPARVYQTSGYGVLAVDDVLAANARSNWQWWMQNLEELVVQQVKVPPVEKGADLFSAVADMIGLRHESRDAMPAATFDIFPWVAQATNIAYCARQPQVMAYVGWDQTSANSAFTGYSEDNGKTWRRFGSAAPGVGGKIAISATDPRNMVWSPAKKAQPVYTTDAGATWNPCSGLPASWQNENEWWSGQILAADQVDGRRFYHYNNGTLFGSTDGGATWNRLSDINTGSPPNAYTIKTSLVPHPQRAGELWVSFARNTNQPNPFPLLRSTDGGRTFARVSSVDSANYVAFGKNAIYLHGRANRDELEAIYQSRDEGGSWVRVSDPLRWGMSGINGLEADLRTEDLVYVATGGRGIFYGAGARSGLLTTQIAPGGITNAASYAAGSVAPGEIVTLFGSFGGSSDLLSAGLDEVAAQSTLAGETQVLFDGIPAPMVYRSAGQLAAIAPFGLSGQESTAVEVLSPAGSQTPVSLLPVREAVPGIFVAFNYSTGTPNSPANPARRGEYLLVYATGLGQTSPASVDGLTANAAVSVAARTTARLGVVEAGVAYAGQAPLFVNGLNQVNIQIPANAPIGDAVPLVLTAAGVSSPATFTVAIRE
jgi:uncharacterized protein (TIGR03437 family)